LDFIIGAPRRRRPVGAPPSCIALSSDFRYSRSPPSVFNKIDEGASSHSSNGLFPPVQPVSRTLSLARRGRSILGTTLNRSIAECQIRPLIRQHIFLFLANHASG